MGKGITIQMISQEERDRRIKESLRASLERELHPIYRKLELWWKNAHQRKNLSELQENDNIIFEWGDDEVYLALKVFDIHGFEIKGLVLDSDRRDYPIDSIVNINFGYDKRFRCWQDGQEDLEKPYVNPYEYIFD